MLQLTPQPGDPMPDDVRPGQFVQVLCEAPGVLLRRPISVCDVSPQGEITLMVKPVGKGTHYLTSLDVGDNVDMVLPLGNGYDTAGMSGRRALLVGGGVGCAPLVYLARVLVGEGASVTVCLGGRTVSDVGNIISWFPAEAECHVSTDDGSAGTHGLVTAIPAFGSCYDRIYCCGPTPMMRAVASDARRRGLRCQVSLENQMACGIGACLCCVEKTDVGNVCVCTEGPVFDIEKLLWE